MNTALIEETTQASTAGTLPFPAVVEHLVAAGVESYRIDYVRRLQTCYAATGETHVIPLGFPVPAIAETFDAPALVAAIRDSQLRGQKFPDFSQRAATAGVQTYTAFLRGQRVIYSGRLGDQHTEWFPGANRPSPIP